MTDGEGLVRPDVDEAGAETIARECYGLVVTASELGSNQDRNFLLTASDGTRSVLRIDNPVFGDDARDAQHVALDAYRAAGVAVPAVLPGLDGALTQRWGGFAVRRSDFAEGEPVVDAGYLAPVVLAEFGALAAASVNALAGLTHAGLDRAQMWDMRVAYEQTVALAPAIADPAQRTRVLAAAEEARASLAEVAAALPVQPIHGDLTDDNVMGRRGADSRLHPHTVLDLGDLGLGWRVAELAVCVSSMLHHDAERPLRVLDTVAAFHEQAPLSDAEARAVWPLVVLRASLLVASGWRQLAIDGANDYARERIAGEQAIFDAATLLPLTEMTEHVLARIGIDAPAFVEADVVGRRESASLATLLPDLDGDVVAVDLDVESAALDEGRWLAPDAEAELIATHLDYGATVVVPYGLFRLTRTAIDSADAAATWPIDTEIHVAAGPRLRLTAPVDGELRAEAGVLRLHLADGWLLEIGGAQAEKHRTNAVRIGDTIGGLAAADEPRTLTVGLRRSDAPRLTASSSGAALVAPERVPAWSRSTTSLPTPRWPSREHVPHDRRHSDGARATAR